MADEKRQMPRGGSPNPGRVGVMLLPGDHVLLVRCPDGVDPEAVLAKAKQDLGEKKTYFHLPPGVSAEVV